MNKVYLLISIYDHKECQDMDIDRIYVAVKILKENKDLFIDASSINFTIREISKKIYLQIRFTDIPHPYPILLYEKMFLENKIAKELYEKLL